MNVRLGGQSTQSPILGSAVLYPSQTVYFVDGMEGRWYSWTATWYGWYDNQPFTNPYTSSPGSQFDFSYRHLGAPNVSCFDGHVISKPDLSTAGSRHELTNSPNSL
jgi:hypothetical protein